MGKYKHHIFICTNKRSEDDKRGSCAKRGSSKIRDFFKKTLSKRGYKGIIRANQAGCLDACAFGPAVVVYPEEVWYTLKTEADALEVIEKHIEKGEIVERLLIPKPWAKPGKDLNIIA
ncbi:MAG: ferredoxin [Nitrospiria bacterium]